MRLKTHIRRMTDVTATTSRSPSPAQPVAPPTALPPTPPEAPAAAAPVTPAAPERRKYDRSLVEGNLRNAVWKLAWPTMLTNIIGGLQGIVDQAVVGNLRGFNANAAIGVSNQIFIIVIIFISSLFTGMSVLVARFVGADNHEMADRTVYQAFLTAMFISLVILAPLGYFASPMLLDLVNAAPAVKAEALPFLRITFVFSSGRLVFFMLGGALRSAGDARTPMVLGVTLTVLNLVLNVILIRGLGPIPSFGTAGSARGTAIASGILGA
jgi:Na+-driven multidrug efflux pump